MDIYELEKILESKANESADDVIRYALLETIPPIADYSLAISILKEHFLKYNDFRMAVIVSFLMSTWESYKENDFISIINSFLDGATDEHKCIINYLKAYDIFMRNESVNKREEYITLLKQSINENVGFVYNYYRLAQVSGKEKAKELTSKALDNVGKVNSVEECKNMSITDLISYECFLKEDILGTTLSQPNYDTIEEYYGSLSIS